MTDQEKLKEYIQRMKNQSYSDAVYDIHDFPCTTYENIMSLISQLTQKDKQIEKTLEENDRLHNRLAAYDSLFYMPEQQMLNVPDSDPVPYVEAKKITEILDRLLRAEKMGKALDDIFMIPSVFGTFKETIVTKRIQEIARQALKDWKEKG